MPEICVAEKFTASIIQRDSEQDSELGLCDIFSVSLLRLLPLPGLIG